MSPGWRRAAASRQPDNLALLATSTRTARYCALERPW
jgi:hypothetical protein